MVGDRTIADASGHCGHCLGCCAVAGPRKWTFDRRSGILTGGRGALRQTAWVRTGQHLPSDVRKATERHLVALDNLAPGLVEGLYLTVSVTLGDYQQGRSDIDFMAFTGKPARMLRSG